LDKFSDSVIRFLLQKATNIILEKVNNMCTVHKNTNFNENHKLGNECDIDNDMFHYKDLDQTIKLGNTINYLNDIHTTHRSKK